MGWFSDKWDNFWDGVGDVVEGFGEVVGGILTLDIEQVGAGYAQIFGGALDVVTFGGFSQLVDWVAEQFEPEAQFNNRKVMATGSRTPASIIYGEARVGGQLVFFESTGTDSQTMYMVVALAPHEVENIGDVYFGEDLVFPNGSSTAQGKFSGRANIWRLDGTQTTALSELVNNAPGWSSDHIGEGVAYVALKLTYDQDAYSRGLPRVSAVVQGRKVYDPRSDTTGYSNNHALCCLDYLQADFGFGVTDDEIDFASFEAAADVADELVAAADGGTEKRYTVNGTISLAASPIDNLNSMQKAGAAIIAYSQGVFYISPGAYALPVADFDESDLIGGISFTTGPGKGDATNTIKGSYIDPRQNYEAVNFPELSLTDYVTRDGEVLKSEIQCPFASTPTLARRLGKIAVQRERFGVACTVQLKYSATAVDVGDRITLSIARLGWDQKVFRVNGASLTLGSGISLSLSEDGPEVWNWAEGEAIDVTPPPAINLPDYGDIAVPLNFAITEELYVANTKADFKVRVIASWDEASDTGKRYDLQYRLVGTTDWVTEVTGYRGTERQIGDFVPGEYEFRVRAGTITGAVSDWVTVEYEVLGKLAPPSTPASINASQQTYGIDINWSPIADLDLLLYELRLDENFGDPGAIYSGRQTIVQDIRRVAGVTYYVRALDTSGNYSAESAMISPTIAAPQPVTSVTAVSIDNNVLLRWSTSDSVYPITRYEIRKGENFGTAETIGYSAGTFEAIIEESNGVFRYWVQPIDAAGQTGAAASALATVDSPPDYVLRTDEFVVFADMTLTNITIGQGGGGLPWDDTSIGWDDTMLRWDDGPSPDLIGPVNTTESFGENMTRSGLSSSDPYGDKIDAGYTHFLQPSLTSGEAEIVIDFEALIPSTRVSVLMDDEALVAGSTASIQMSTAETLGVWTDFNVNQTEFSASNFRYLRIKVMLSSDGIGLHRVNSIRYRLDVKQKTDQGRADVLASDTEGTTIFFNKTFIDVDSVTATPKAIDAKIAVTEFEDVGNQDRFSVRVFDRATGDRVDATINWIARGS